MVDSIGHDPVRQDAGEVADGPELDKEERAARQLIMTLGGKPEPTALSDRETEDATVGTELTWTSLSLMWTWLTFPLAKLPTACTLGIA